MGCTSLNYIKSNSISEFHESAFEGCTALKELETETAIVFSKYCFKGSALTQVKIRNYANLEESILEGNTYHSCVLIYNKDSYETGL